MRINRLGEPHTVFEPECLIGKRTYRANIYNISYKVVVQRFIEESADLCMIAALQDAMLAFSSELVGGINASETHDATCHVQGDIRAYVLFLKSTALKVVACTFATVVIA